MKKILFAVVALLMAGCPAFAERPDGDETWHYLGTGLVRDDLLTHFYYSDNFEFEAEFWESDQVPGRYKVVDAYKNHPWGSDAALIDHEHFFVVDAADPDHVWIEKGCLGMNRYYRLDYREFAIWSPADHEYNDIYGNWEEVEANAGRIWGTLVDGAITFPRYQVLIGMYYPEDDDDPNSAFVHPDGGYNANVSGKFRLKLPGAPNYDLSAVYSGYTGTAPNATLNFSVMLGADIDYVRYVITPSQADVDPVATLENGGGEKVDRSQAGMFGDLTISAPYTGDGSYIFTVMAFDASGNSHGYAQEGFSIEIDETVWKKFGSTTWVEGILCDHEANMYGQLYLEPEVIPADIEVNTDGKSLRLVNPFMNHSLASRQTYDYSKNYYMEFGIIDTDHVHMTFMEATGYNLGYGDHWIWSKADRSLIEEGFTPEAIDAIYGTFGKLDMNTGEITFPENSLLLNFHVRDGIPPYWANSKGNFKVTVPAPAVEYIKTKLGNDAVEGIECAEDVQAEYYTLDGIRIAEPAAPGMYIVRKGNKTEKVAL